MLYHRAEFLVPYYSPYMICLKRVFVHVFYVCWWGCCLYVYVKYLDFVLDSYFKSENMSKRRAELPKQIYIHLNHLEIFFHFILVLSICLYWTLFPVQANNKGRKSRCCFANCELWIETCERPHWPAFSSTGGLPALWIWRCTLASLRCSHTIPSRFGRSKVSSSPSVSHVRNWSPSETPAECRPMSPGNRRKLRGPVNVTATKTGSEQENVTLPWVKRVKDRVRDMTFNKHGGLFKSVGTETSSAVFPYKGC